MNSSYMAEPQKHSVEQKMVDTREYVKQIAVEGRWWLSLGRKWQR